MPFFNVPGLTIDKLKDEVFTSQSTLTIPIGFKQYRHVMVRLNWNAGGVNTIALTGMSAATFAYSFFYNNSTTPGAGTTNGANNWAVSTSAGATSAGGGVFNFSLLPATSGQKTFEFTQSDAFVGTGPITRTGAGYTTDAVNDPTAIVFTLDASRSGYIYAVGYV